MNCEMVGFPDGSWELALICVVNFFTGEKLMHTFVDPGQGISDWRTSGWREAQEELFRPVDDTIIFLGNTLFHDLAVLRIHASLVVDSVILTAEAIFGKNAKFSRLRSLKDPNLDICSLNIHQQASGGHDCLEDTLASKEVVLRCLLETARLRAWAIQADPIGPVCVGVFYHVATVLVTDDRVARVGSLSRLTQLFLGQGPQASGILKMDLLTGTYALIERCFCRRGGVAPW
ncbi:hypothetical protein JX266_003025 [Neoarthrinium moseri]|nr:hypothetical protein JX266_003025 [Neoarthrinium moseri]